MSFSEEEKDRLKERLKIERQFKRGANWFFWIAGLSLINSLIILFGGEWGFLVGLGITQVFDFLGQELAKEIGPAVKVIAFFLNLLVLGIFILLGVLAGKRYRGAYIGGMILYGLDGLLFLLVGDFLSLGFHVFVLFCLGSGLRAESKLKELEAKEKFSSSGREEK